jgi:NAD(P)-dependent dehydrogenase (short-subunit alcohol dehydrogenase family)
MDLGIAGKTALVTGGANGIGRDISLALAGEGVNIIYTTRDTSLTGDFEDDIKTFAVSVEGIEVNFHDAEWAGRFAARLDGFNIDILVNNAGHTCDVTDPYCDMDDWMKVIGLNFLTPVQICNMVIPKMKKADWGRIVNITSCAGLENSGPVTYGVSKAQLTAYSRTMGRILATENPNIVMTALFPGVVATKGGHWDRVLEENPAHAEQYLRERTPLNRFGETTEIANVVLFYCSRIVSFCQGAIVPVDGGQSKHYMSFNYLD